MTKTKSAECHQMSLMQRENPTPNACFSWPLTKNVIASVKLTVQLTPKHSNEPMYFLKHTRLV